MLLSSEPDTSQSLKSSRQERGKNPTAVLSSSDDDSDPVVSKPNRAHRNISAWKERSFTPGYSRSRLIGSPQLHSKERRQCFCFVLIGNVGIPSTSQKRVETLSPAQIGRIAEEDRVAPRKRNTRSSARNNSPLMMANYGTLKETDTDDSEEPVRSTPKRPRRRLSFSNSTDDTTDKLAGTTRHAPSRTTRKIPPPISIKTTSSTMVDDSSEDVVPTPRSRLRTRNESSPKTNFDQSDEQEADDLREDMKYLHGSGGFCDFAIPWSFLLTQI